MHIQVNSVIDDLNQLYKSAINAKEDIFFITYIYDYIIYINQNPVLGNIIKDLEKQKANDYKIYYQLKTKAKKELGSSKKKIYQIINKFKIKNEKINELLRRIELWGDDETTLNFDLLTLFDGNIPEKYKNGLYSQSNDINYKNYKFSKSLELLHKERDKNEDLKICEIWYCWYKVKFIPFNLKKLETANENTLVETLSEEESKYFFETKILVLEILKRISGNYKERLKEYKFCFERLHNHFISKLREFELSEDANKKEKVKVGGGKKVNIIEVDEYGKVYINKDYNHFITPRDSINENQYWEKIKEIAKGKDVIYEGGTVKYFNSNKNNPIYKKLGYEITKILERKGRNMKDTIKIENITNEKISRSKGQREKK